ncbi:MATE family efflux transporter [Aetokthonos hydrillicola Thurmond2011]|jgi:MATE family multidrug resistance protein|uniref:Probable multidrug resistance protein NorM n=1 Tax=Aetokthonos hydrillicola Thurmond2011 TaxID=2712845 RepID=A0AAP5I522_9CYAN|nr:guanitoxin biosynthesis MATE family efflux transporter GntT [Aetokthonos hydrillicola]MBO3460037.1 MATE family efflux transporter [Aetokthonos hydrillicola CCALA 1050]MBW4584634.1 MATE family efflux transporter [Aetokthonos hydrillicola CCALA 1050]MDR9895178.1 MATE family efflux transporter [Aetokthonos hydrillicola Thurmond2011]
MGDRLRGFLNREQNKTLFKEYNFLSRFYRLAFINILSTIMEPLVGTISIVFLGHQAQIEHLAGVTLSTTLFNYMYFIVNFLRMGTTGVTAQAVGRNDSEQMLLVALRNSLIGLAIGGLLLVLQYPLQHLWFSAISAVPEVKASGINYFNTRIWGAPAVVVNLVLIGWFLGREMSSYVLLMSVVGNGANIFFDYVFIVRWNMGATGAGLSQAISPYLVLVIGITLAILKIDWKEFPSAASKFWDAGAFKKVVTLNGNLFIRSSATMFVATIFTILASTLGTTILAENALLLQVALLSIYCFEAIGFATETLSGNFKGQQTTKQLLPLLQVTVGTSLQIGIICSVVCILFPETIFGLLTNYSEVTSLLTRDVPWLLPILAFSSVYLILDGYFAGLALGSILRNAALFSVIFGFAPLALIAWYYHNNYILLSSVSVWALTRAILLALQVPSTLKDLSQAQQPSFPSSGNEA